jgi:nitrate ABC transporter ATP-binding subunit
MKSLLELWDLGKSFGDQVVVDHFRLKVAEHEFVSIIGHSGCGKSTVLSMVAGLVKSDTGGIVLGNREVLGPGLDRGVVFQSPCLFPWMTAEENVVLAVEAKHPDWDKRRLRGLAAEHLALVGLGDALAKRPAELSAGMRQRVGLARAFALSPKLLLLDEPFGMLDSLTRLELQDILLDLLKREGLTALMVTHDVDEALYLSDRVVMMTNGPAAHVGDILTVPFARPRDRRTMLDDNAYYAEREKLIGFLEGQAHPAPPIEEPTQPDPVTAIADLSVAS